MDLRHKRKAIWGLFIWLSIVPAAFLLLFLFYGLFSTEKAVLNDIAITIVIAAFIGLNVSFLWGAGHLARAKGYSYTILLWGIFCLISHPIVWLILWLILPDKNSDSYRSSRRQKLRRDESPIARVIRFRRNALIFNSIGIIGIVLAVFVGLVPFGLFEEQDNAQALAVLMFIPAYCSVLYGCWFWVKAKNWHEAVIFIGLMPLAPMFIRFVRILYFHFLLQLLPILMIFAPIILISVIAALPDKSGIPKRKRRDHDSWKRGGDK
jgi:hypothetical protein